MLSAPAKPAKRPEYRENNSKSIQVSIFLFLAQNKNFHVSLIREMIPSALIVKIFLSSTVFKSCNDGLFFLNIKKNKSASKAFFAFCIAGSTSIALPISESSIKSIFLGLTFF